MDLLKHVMKMEEAAAIEERAIRENDYSIEAEDADDMIEIVCESPI